MCRTAQQLRRLEQCTVIWRGGRRKIVHNRRHAAMQQRSNSFRILHLYCTCSTPALWALSSTASRSGSCFCDPPWYVPWKTGSSKLAAMSMNAQRLVDIGSRAKPREFLASGLAVASTKADDSMPRWPGSLRSSRRDCQRSCCPALHRAATPQRPCQTRFKTPLSDSIDSITTPSRLHHDSSRRYAVRSSRGQSC